MTSTKGNIDTAIYELKYDLNSFREICHRGIKKFCLSFFSAVSVISSGKCEYQGLDDKPKYQWLGVRSIEPTKFSAI